tara:strand:- start:4028 stop:4255 length:228 start_codon:yes stop_codon:yes gene_type:complete
MFGKLKATALNLRKAIANVGIHVGGWLVVKTLKVAPAVLELSAYALVTVGLGLAYTPLFWISAGLSLWIVAHGSQ